MTNLQKFAFIKMPQERHLFFLKKEVSSINILCNGKKVNSKDLSGLKKIRGINPIRIKSKDRFLKRVERELVDKNKVVVMGGDGTISLVVKKVIEANASLGIIPSGRGNDFASFLGIPDDLRKAVEVAKKGELKRVSLGEVGGRYFCNSFGIGFDALVVGLANRYKTGYRLTTAKTMLGFESFPLSVRAILENGETVFIEDDLLMLVFINGETEGGGLRLGKKKDPGESFLTMVAIREIPKPLRPLLFSLFLIPFLKSFPKVERFKIKRATVSTSNNIRKHIDGDVFHGSIKKVNLSRKELTVIT